MFRKVDTKLILGVISVVDLIWGTQGLVTIILWVMYGIYRS